MVVVVVVVVGLEGNFKSVEEQLARPFSEAMIEGRKEKEERGDKIRSMKDVPVLSLSLSLSHFLCLRREASVIRHVERPFFPP